MGLKDWFRQKKELLEENELLAKELQVQEQAIVSEFMELEQGKTYIIQAVDADQDIIEELISYIEYLRTKVPFTIPIAAVTPLDLEGIELEALLNKIPDNMLEEHLEEKTQGK